MNRIEMVVIGASAGGVEALCKLLGGLGPDFDAAIAVVLHLPPGEPSLLPRLLSERCVLPVKEVEDKEPVQPGMVFIAPPDYHMLVESDTSFSLSRDEPVLYSRPSIDVLFESAAIAYGPALLGIILTGASADGAMGMKTLRSHGGQAWIQDPGDAAVQVMPLAAIAAAGSDLIGSIDAMMINLPHINNPDPEKTKRV